MYYVVYWSRDDINIVNNFVIVIWVFGEDIIDVVLLKVKIMLMVDFVCDFDVFSILEIFLLIYLILLLLFYLECDFIFFFSLVIFVSYF